MNSRNHFLLKLILLFFTISVSCTAIPGNFLYSRNLIGEITAVSVSETDNTYGEVSHPQKHNSASQDAVIRIFNEWFAICIAILVLKYLSYTFCLPHCKTIVTLKVRMDC